MLRKKKAKDKRETEKVPVEEDDQKQPEQCPNETPFVLTFDEYRCSGNVEIDFPGLCALLNIEGFPSVKIQHPISSSATDNTREETHTEESQSDLNTPYKPCLQVDLESENPLSVMSMKISGWKVDEQIAKVLVKMLPSLIRLQSLYFWQARLTHQTLISLMSTMSLCSNLRVVAVEGNPLPQQSYHILLSEDSGITQLCLRNNQMGDEGARLIGSALSTTRSANKNLVSLNLAFNSIGDAGATYIAQGLRLNRTLRFLSLSNNHIGDSGAAHLAAILGKFALTHEEVVERRKLLAEKAQSLAANNENQKSVKKSDLKVSPTKTSKPKIKEKQSCESKSDSSLEEVTETVEVVHPLLDKSVERSHGQIFLLGNTTLRSLNLSGNKITEKSLPLFAASLEMQAEGKGLSRLCLQRNHFSEDCESYLRVKELLALKDPPKVQSSESSEE